VVYADRSTPASNADFYNNDGRTNRRVAITRPVPLARVAAEHHHSNVAGAYRPTSDPAASLERLMDQVVRP
jgi:hypothetical protein